MISFGKWPRVLFASVLAMALWTFISVNTNIFSVDGKFDGFMYFASYILVIGVWALVAVKINVSDKFYKAISIFIFALTPFFCMQVAMILSGAAEYSFGIYFINIMFYVAIMAIIFAITRSMKWDGNSNKSRCVLIQLVQLRCKYFKRHTANSKRLPCNRYGGTGSGKLHISTEIPDCCCNGYSGVGYNVNR